MTTTAISPTSFKTIVREAAIGDIPDLVDIHATVFANTVMSQLGHEYLNAYYRDVLSFNGRIVIVAQVGDEIVGFASGVLHPERFYRRIVRNGWKTAGLILKGVLRKPSLLASIPYSIARVFRSTPRLSAENSCELSFIAMRPEASGKGIGKELALEFLNVARRQGAEFVRLTTHAESNEATNNFYSALGFKVYRTFRQCHGCLTNEYVYPTGLGTRDVAKFYETRTATSKSD